MYISRSQIETYLSTCQYRSYINYGLQVDGKKIGLSSSFLSIDLACGSALHAGVAYLLGLVKSKQDYDVTEQCFDLALAVANAELENPAIRDGKIPQDNPALLDFSVKEHKWLVEAMLWAWYRVELPKIQASKKVILVEKEIELELTRVANNNKPKARVFRDMNEAIAKNREIEYEDEIIMLGSRCDALLLDLESDCFEAQSLKTTKQLGIFTDQMVNRDLQTALEIYALEYWLEQQQISTALACEMILNTFGQHEAESVKSFLTKKVPTGNKKVESVKYTFFVKGQRKDNDSYKVLGEDYKRYPLRDNPYLYGWRKLVEKTTQEDSLPEFEYAHSFRFFNPANKSTYGQLGKGWNKFIVEEDYPGGIRKWIDDINYGKIQPNAKNPIEDIIVTQTDSRIESHLQATIYTAKKVATEFYLRANASKPAEEFLANTKSCTWPLVCDFAPICQFSGVSMFSPEIAADPIGSGLYQIRIPHHEPERKYFVNPKD